jgi:hypothetical protein
MGKMEKHRIFKTPESFKLAANAVTNLIIPGLKGDMDVEYEIILDLTFPTNANNRALHLEPNSDNTHVTSIENTTKNDGSVAGFGINYIVLANLLAGYEGEVYGKYSFRSSRNGRDRILLGLTDIFRGSDILLAPIGGRYSEKTTEITSLKLAMDNGPFYGEIIVDKWIEV